MQADSDIYAKTHPGCTKVQPSATLGVGVEQQRKVFLRQNLRFFIIGPKSFQVLELLGIARHHQIELPILGNSLDRILGVWQFISQAIQSNGVSQYLKVFCDRGRRPQSRPRPYTRTKKLEKLRKNIEIHQKRVFRGFQRKWTFLAKSTRKNTQEAQKSSPLRLLA